MSEEIARLKVSVTGAEDAEKKLQVLDKLVEKLNNSTATVTVHTNLTAAMQAVEKNVAVVQQNIAANAALIQSGNALAAAEMQNAEYTDKAVQAQKRLFDSMQQTAQVQAEQAAASIRAQGLAVQEAEAKARLVKIEINASESSEQVAEANAKELNAKAKLVKAESALAVAREKSYQEAQKTQQAIERTTQAELRQATAAARQAASEQARIKRGFETIGAQVLRLVAQNIQKATAELKAMNKEMVSIQKVTEATDAEMERLKDSAFKVAAAMGSTPSDYLSSVTKWAQAGYKGLSDQLGELSAKTQVVGDVNEETANKFLLAVDAAYKYKGNVGQLTQVLDGANEISNNYATSVDKLANGMGIVSSLAEQAGMKKVEETMAAIGTITAKTQESGNSAARALRALILNIQGSTEIEIDTETGERWSEEEIQRTAAALGKLNVATREYKDGILSLRNPMEVVGELAEKYQKGLVTETQLQEVVSSLGGKVRSNQLMALIQGYGTYTDMIETYKDALGSADKELEIYLNGWEAKSNRLVNQWTQFVESFKASDISMGMLDAGNALLGIANTDLGNAVAQIGAVTAAILALKAAAKTEKGAAILGALNVVPQELEKIKNKALEAAAPFTGLKATLKGAEKGATELGAALTSALGPVGLTVVAITALSAAYDLFGRQAAKAAEALADAKSEYEQSTAQLESLRSELETTQARIDELNAKDSPTVVEREELDKLNRENTDLERQIAIQEQLNKVKKETLDLAAREALNAGYSGADKSLFEKIFTNYSKPENFINMNLAGKGFKEGAEWLSRELDRLNKQKDEFLQSHPDGSTWTEAERRKFEKLEGKISTYQQYAAGFYQEMQGNIQNLAGDASRAQWEAVGEALYDSMFPAEALTEKFNRLVDAMDEAEQTRFHEELERIQKDGKVTAQEVQTLIDKFPALKPVLEGSAGALDTLAQHLTETASASQEAAGGISETGDAAKNTQADVETLATELKTAVSGMEAVRDAQEELASSGTLSTNTLISLLGKHGEAIDDVILKYMSGLATQEEISEALKKAYQEDLDAYRSALLAKNMDNEDFYSSWLAGNAGTVKKLAAQYGVDANSYKTFSELKTAIESAAQTEQTNAVIQGRNDRVRIFQDIQTAFASTQNAMVIKAQQTAGMISQIYAGLAGVMRGIQGLAGKAGAMITGAVQDAQFKQQQDAMNEILNSISAPVSSPSKSSSKGSGGSGSAKSYYEQQIEGFKKLEEAAKRTNQVLERSEEDTSRKRIKNLRDLQAKVQSMQKDFIARGLAETSDEVNQVKLLYAGLEDDIRSIYSSMADRITEQHDRLIWEFDLKANNTRTMEQIAADDAAMVEQYRKMQDDVHKLAEYYRSQGVRENDKLVQNLQDQWWEYEKSIRSMYSNLTDAFNDYIDESSHKIEELGRNTGNVGKQIEIYAQRIQRAQEAIAALQGQNIGGALNGDIHDLESQIWGDKDAIRDLQEGLWQELEDAFDDIFDKAKEDIDAIGDEIEAIQDQMDDINDVLSQYDKELEGILKPINATLEKLNEQLEAEKKRLEERTAPLNERIDGLKEQISGYYTVNPDGSIGDYIPGLDDEIDEIQDQLDKANEELDRVNDAWNEQKKREEEALALQKKQLAVEEAQKAVQDAMLALQTARNERNVYTLKDGVWAWRADEEAVAKAEKALADAEKAKEEAEKDLQDYKEEQAHKQIVKRLEEQIKALEEQKKLLDKQKDLINKQIDALSKQIAAYEKESKARQELIQNLIDQKEREKEAWENHYEALKEQYSQQLEYLEAEKKAAEERKKLAEKQYDQWMDTWKDIQKSIETPARDISEILNDIAKYGTPAMAGQIDQVTELLRDLGYVLDDVTSGGGYDPDDGGSGGSEMSRREIIDQMLANAQAYQSASKEEQDRLYKENQRLGASIGAVWDPNTWTWDIFDYSGGTVTVRPWAYDSDWAGYDLKPMRTPTLDELENDEWARNKAKYGYLTGDDWVAARSYVSSPVFQGATTIDDHSQHMTINGLKVGSDTVQRPLSEILQLISLHMGT